MGDPVLPDRLKDRAGLQGAVGPWYREEPCSAERLLTLMDDAGVDRAVLVQPVSAYGFDNDYTADAAQSYATRYTSVACLDPGAERAAERADSTVADSSADRCTDTTAAAPRAAASRYARAKSSTLGWDVDSRSPASRAATTSAGVMSPSGRDP